MKAEELLKAISSPQAEQPARTDQEIFEEFCKLMGFEPSKEVIDGKTYIGDTKEESQKMDIEVCGYDDVILFGIFGEDGKMERGLIHSHVAWRCSDKMRSEFQKWDAALSQTKKK